MSIRPYLWCSGPVLFARSDLSHAVIHSPHACSDSLNVLAAMESNNKQNVNCHYGIHYVRT